MFIGCGAQRGLKEEANLIEWDQVEMIMNGFIALTALAFIGIIISATILMMRHRAEMRAAALEAAALDVLSEDTRRAIRGSLSDHSETSDSPEFGDCGDGDGGD
jgi:hypothetical protein